MHAESPSHVAARCRPMGWPSITTVSRRTVMTRPRSLDVGWCPRPTEYSRASTSRSRWRSRPGVLRRPYTSHSALATACSPIAKSTATVSTSQMRSSTTLPNARPPRSAHRGSASRRAGTHRFAPAARCCRRGHRSSSRRTTAAGGCVRDPPPAGGLEHVAEAEDRDGEQDRSHPGVRECVSNRVQVGVPDGEPQEHRADGQAEDGDERLAATSVQERISSDTCGHPARATGARAVRRRARGRRTRARTYRVSGALAGGA